ncbi:hypothetical protein EDB85DRAFT_1892934 [Lactarius pseudohatsudake]|nr:hypothetical protein EDB85DRAFT_1892934 [Lactarius pseudohatsudake]
MSSREQPGRLNFTKTRGRGVVSDYTMGTGTTSAVLGEARLTALEYFPIDNVKYVVSYNWIDTEKPTIVVLGSPAIWTERVVPFELQPNHGLVFVDQHSARLSEYPMLPLFTADAIHDHQAAMGSVDWPTVDVVMDHNGLHKLHGGSTR